MKSNNFIHHRSTDKSTLSRSLIIYAVDILLSVLATYISLVTVSVVFDFGRELFRSDLLIFTSFALSFLLSWILSLHRYVVRYFELEPFVKIIFLATIKGLIMFVTTFLIVSANYTEIAIYAAVLDAIFTVLLLVFVRVFLMVLFSYLDSKPQNKKISIFVFGTSGQNPHIVQMINSDHASKYFVNGFFSVNKNGIKNIIGSNRVYSVNQSESDLLSLFRSKNIEGVLFTTKERFALERGKFVEFCLRNRIKVLLSDSIHDLSGIGEYEPVKLKEIQVEDLLGRPEIGIDTHSVLKYLKHKVVMVTGAAGSIGSEIARQLANFHASKLVLFDMAETAMHNLQLEFEKDYPDMEVVYVLGDVRSTQRVRAIMEMHKPNIVFHAAAYKHVPMVESNPCEGVMVNVWGSLNVAESALACNIGKFIMVSTDKAVNPTNVMGATKRIAEMCIQNLNRKGKTEFITTRFGNVLGSNGSVIELFKNQIAAGGPITVTHPDIIRYFMTIPEACRLVLQAGSMGNAGEILVFDMGQPVKIVDLAKRMVQLSGLEIGKDIEIKYTGLRPGEKLYEELLSDKENRKSTHDKIQIANSVVPDETELFEAVNKLLSVSKDVDVDEAVRLMKEIVPEYISENSIYEKFDKGN